MFGRIFSTLSCVTLMGCVSPTTNQTFDPNSTSGIGLSRFARLESVPKASVSADRDCSDFASGFKAQRFFQSKGGPAKDPHDLDRDGDGYACEWGVELRQREAAAREAERRRAVAAQQASRRRAAIASRCYTGPRGGTYTITASGNKNYGGC